LEFEEISREELLEGILKERKLLEDVLASIDPQDYLEPVFEGDWSIKDMLAHIVAWEQRMITWVGQAAEGILPDMPGNDQEVELLNSQSYHQDKDLPLDQVLQAFERSYPQALSVAENTPEEVLFTKDLFEARENPFWITVGANTSWHYKEHREALERHLASRGGSAE
jgi:hypothetical protein